MSSRSVSLKRKVNLVLPHWMTDDLINETHDTLFSSSAPRELLRSQNLTMQTELRLWTMMRDLLAKQNLGGDEMEEGYIEERCNQIVQFLLHQQDDGRRIHGPGHDWMRVPDPAGALPIHSCFLLGVPHLGKKLIERFYNSPELLSLPYMSDFEVWKDVGVVQERDGIDDGGLYTGETVLHIAIINDDIETVTWMLERGADIGSRAHGAFFSPEVVRKEVDKAPSIWQRLLAWVQDRDLVNDPIVATTTNKDSACYYGEFPLSFAVCMGNIDVCNLLVEHFRKRLEKNDPSVAKMYDYLSAMPTSEGKEMRAFSKRTKSVKKLDTYNERQLENHAAFKPGQPLDFFISAQDSHGNTAMHLAVLHGRKESIDWIAAQPGGKFSLELLNNDGFTPLTLAARLGSVKMFHHVLECMRETVWSYGNVHMTKTSLLQIDTFRVKGSTLHQRPKWRSALDIIVRHEIEDFSADELFNKLISSKWDRFGRSMYIWRTFIPYCIILIVFSTMLTIECARQRNKWNKQLVDGPWVSDEGISFNTLSQSPERWMSNVLQTFLLVVGVPWLTVMGWKLRRLGPKDYDPNEDGDISAEEVMFFVFKNSSFFLDFSAAITICVAYSLGFERQLEFERYTLQTWAVTSILLWCNFLNVRSVPPDIFSNIFEIITLTGSYFFSWQVIMPFEFFGILVIIMYKMLIGDFFKFFAVYTIMILAFSQAMFCLFQMPDFPSESLRIDQDPFQAFLKLVWVSLGDVDSTARNNPLQQQPPPDFLYKQSTRIT